MKRLTLMILGMLLLVFLIPALLGGISSLFQHGSDKKNGKPDKVTVWNTSTEKVDTLDLEEYLLGVLIGEMPASYELEALKAQAVAARSYVLDKILAYEKGVDMPQHHGAILCTDFGHCQAYVTPKEAEGKWGREWSGQYLAKMKAAVRSTAGEYLVYDDQVVKAVFCSISSGRTEDVTDVWGGDLPYLKSVPSEGDTTADGYETTAEFTRKEFLDRLHEKNPDLDLDRERPLEELIGEATYTGGGSVKTIQLGGLELKGTEVRSLFGLRSANFQIQCEGDQVKFDVKGYGHGVGMSQYGANYMAKSGKNYQDILKHYYTDVKIVKF